ncbi:hypothetical protein GH714_017682 [Hevea brasiliensis]|uniref:ABC transporter domain-containing protein n=1 Tax=Hevea brasiliensis TaxID=3981 RepID=A0A6A6K5A2_HEVBR|nr:hypothetical protein GH714_017682 [Hevea brasiliensis]
MDSAVNVPRWTPKPSTVRSPLKKPTARVDDELELPSMASDEDDKSLSMDTVAKTPSLNKIEMEATVGLINEDKKQQFSSNGRNGDGIFCTWKDLSVTVGDGKNGRGNPARANREEGLIAGRLSSNTQQTGEILINGHKVTLAFGTSAYVTQDDTLMTTLTVREAVYYSAQLQLPDFMSISEKKQRAEMTIREMGLQDSVDTRIGGWSTKGLSGGQKRRVSICIEILTRPKLLFLDEPTSGLDSAASYHVMKRIVRLAKRDGRTVIASIHQPSSEVFELFHNLCLLSYGRTVYFGPVSIAEKFFSSNGFPCPSLRNPSDHYLRTINKDFDGKGKILEKKGSQASFITQCIVLTKRSFVNMCRDLGYYWLRLAIYIALCLCVGTIFHDIGFTYGSIQARGSMLMFVAAFLTFMAIGGFPSFVEDMKIFERERLNGHYGVGAFVVGNTFSSIPYLLIISLVPGAIAYYLVGLQKSFQHFAYFALLLFACMMLVESLMMTVASIVPDFLMGIITGAGIHGVMMLNGGRYKTPSLDKIEMEATVGLINEDKKQQFSSNGRNGDGIFCTWKDLSVTVGDGKNGRRVILQGLTGYAQPEDVLCVMGPSGCGKSTLLDALAGRLSSNTQQTGEILINGHKVTLAFGTSAYVTQDDTLMTTLTVREAVYYSAQLQLPDFMSISEKKQRAEMTIREMGLQDSVDTRIGGWSTKGLSGGQKRRVSICIEILTRPKLFLDEPTSGLDSAASYHVMKRIVRLAKRDGRTVIASIHQPSSEVFELFHNLCLLSYGRTVYFGPVSIAEKEPSDHYLRTINKDFDGDLEQGLGGFISTEEAINVLVKSYESSEIFQQVKQQVAYICEKARGSMLMFVAAFLTFMAIGGFPSFVEDMKIFERERLNGHYGVESLMMTVASIVPDFLMGIITGAGIQGVMMLNGGFFRLPDDLSKPFWRYPMYYIAFHKYANQGFYKNEFEGLTFPIIKSEGRLPLLVKKFCETFGK